MSLIDNEGKRLVEPGSFEVYAGGSQPDARSRELTGTGVLNASFEVVGKVLELEY